VRGRRGRHRRWRQLRGQRRVSRDHSQALHLLVRKDGLADHDVTLPARRTRNIRRFTLRTRTELVRATATRHLEQIQWRDSGTGVVETHEIRHGVYDDGRRAEYGLARWMPRPRWRGFLKTGPDLSPEDLTTGGWPLARPPYHLETNRPGVFAIRDVRSGNIKRVASAVVKDRIPSPSCIKVLHQ